MKSGNKREIIANVIFCVLLFSSSVNCASSNECVQNLENKAVYEGQLNTIMNLSAVPQNVSWTLRPILQDNYTYTIIDYGGAWNQSMTDLYAVNQTGLIIRNATITGGRMSTAGLYNGMCAANMNRTGAKLLIVRSGPLCSCSLIPYPMSVSNINVSCNVSFADSRLNPIQPIVTWRHNGTSMITSTLQRTTIDQYLYGATSSILTNSVDAENYVCELTFAAPADNQNKLLATNAPLFTASCTGCGAMMTTARPMPMTTGRYSSRTLTRKPINTVDVDGSSNITLDCASSNGSDVIGWSFTPLGSGNYATIQISVGNLLLSNNHRNYELRATTSSIVLIIRQLSNLTEGTYDCHDRTEQATALLLIIPNQILLGPLFGPLAGGTNITITGSNTTVAFSSTFVGSYIPDITGVTTVYIGYDLLSAMIDYSSFPIQLSVGTPNTTEAFIGQPLPIIIEFSPKRFNLTFNRAFTYLPNPEIASVYPHQFIVDGGTLLDVTGESLSSVAVPIIELTLFISRTTNNSSTPNISTTITTRVCTTINDSFMQCPMPTLNLPNDILEIINSGYNESTPRRRRDLSSIDQFTGNQHRIILSRSKRDVNSVLSVNGSNGVVRVDVYFGFVLDGYQKYRNINDQHPEITFFFCSGPVINSSKDLKEFDPNAEEFLEVQGSNLLRCSILRDYVVHIGDQICTNSDITDNQLRCRPPKEKPSSTENDTKYCDQYLSISITLGNKQYQYACLTYTDPSSEKTFGLIVGLTVGLCGLGIFLTILITCILTCRRRKQSAVTDGHRSNGRGTHQYSDVVVSGETPAAYNGNYINADELRLDDDEFGRPGQLPGSYPKPTDDNYLTSTA